MFVAVTLIIMLSQLKIQHKRSTKKIFTLFEGRHADHNGLTTVTLCNKNEIVQVCYNCF